MAIKKRPCDICKKPFQPKTTRPTLCNNQQCTDERNRRYQRAHYERKKEREKSMSENKPAPHYTGEEASALTAQPIPDNIGDLPFRVVAPILRAIRSLTTQERAILARNPEELVQLANWENE